MGLYASFTPEELGYPVTLEQEVLGEVVTVDVEYAEACEAFCMAFLETATSLVPVRTGFLLSTIDANTDGHMCEAEATAEYAQYVEYGTWKMDAQPYFEPGVQAGLEAFQAVAGEALGEAEEELRELCQAVIDAAMEAFGGESLIEDIGGMMIGAAFLWMMFPVFLYAYGIMKTLGGDDYKYFEQGMAGNVGGISIEIT